MIARAGAVVQCASALGGVGRTPVVQCCLLDFWMPFGGGRGGAPMSGRDAQRRLTATSWDSRVNLNLPRAGGGPNLSLHSSQFTRDIF